ncbi:MAG: apolipoprotein N-acyltransferase, partial [Planctomycetes bacterium]|nr:apolipoprotein N-acyltransferase [Planctomycetota bacterium]
MESKIPNPKSKISAFGPLLLTFLLLTASFPPLDLGLLAWVALVPWLLALPSLSLRQAALHSYLLGFAFFAFNLHWLRYVTVLGWLMLSLYLACYFLVFGLVLRLLDLSKAGERSEVRGQRSENPKSEIQNPKSRHPSPVTRHLAVPACWVALEYVRSFLMTGFPWLFLGHTQYRFLPLIQVADIAGVYGLSFLIVLTNLCLAAAWRERRNVGRLVAALAGPAVLIAACLVYGHARLSKLSVTEGPLVGIVQGNIPQEVKEQMDPEELKRSLAKHVELSKTFAGAHVDMLIWPETMVPGVLNLPPEYRREIDVLSLKAVDDLARMTKTHLLLGGIAVELRPTLTNRLDQRNFNSAYFYSPSGELLGRYDKLHLVPFGEYTPLKRYFPFLSKLVPYEVGLSAGTDWTLFRLDSWQFGVLICYEDTVAPLAREFRRRGASFMVNVTNDGWFRDSAELEQHLAISAFRCIENRIGLVRAANTGISSFLSPTGQIHARLVIDGQQRV